MFLLTTAVIASGFLYYYWKEIVVFVDNFIECPPGIGKIKKRGKKYIVETNEGNFKLNYIELPSIDTEVNFLLSDEQFETDTFTLKKEEQNFRFKAITYYSRGIIADVYYPSDVVKRDYVYIFITSPFENDYYVKKIENNECIDYRKIFIDYDNALRKKEVEDAGAELEEVD